MSNQKLPSISTDFSGWYNEVIYQAELVEQSPVRGTMIVRPYGWAIWEHIQQYLDGRIKATGHHNASFPLFIPESFLRREAEHVEGFAPELAVVTHAGGEQLEEPLIVRPTSETIIHHCFAKWIKSWRDLPLKLNQWCNVVRWEKRSRPFLRTTEFFWQEGHTAHATREDALEEVLLMLEEYRTLAHDLLAIPVVTGQKTPTEKFPGADITYTFEALMQDGKSLQMGTSHLLSQTFAHAFDVKFQDKEGKQIYPWFTSWAITTRLVGAAIMVHGDDKGLVLPPPIAPIQCVIVPILKKDQDSSELLQIVHTIADDLKRAGIRVHIDDREDQTPGAKFYHWELRGVPMRIEIGARDLAAQQVTMVTRATSEKKSVSLAQVLDTATITLHEIQHLMLARATERRNNQWFKAEKLDVFGPQLDEKPGFYEVGWCGMEACELRAKEYKATTRCILETKQSKICYACNMTSKYDILVAKAY